MFPSTDTGGATSIFSPAEEEHKHKKRSKEKKHKNKKLHKHKKEKKVDRRMERMKCVLFDSPPLTSPTFPPHQKKKQKKHKHKGKEEKKRSRKEASDSSSEGSDEDSDGGAGQASAQELLQRSEHNFLEKTLLISWNASCGLRHICSAFLWGNCDCHR